MKKTKEQRIPHGVYCYRVIKLIEGKNGELPILKTKNCPFMSSREYNGIAVHFCEYLNKGDPGMVSDKDYKKLLKYFGSEEKLKEVLPLSLLWDGCKECGVNEEYDEETK